MKKKLILLASLIIGVIVLISCGQSSTDTDSSPDEAVECTHEYTYASTKMPTCTEGGSATLECSLCGFRKDVTLDPAGHDFKASFDWSSDYTHASVLLECKRDASHVYNVSATIYEETVEPSCKTVGSQKITAKVTWGGKDYTDVKEFNLGLGECKNTYSFTLHGDSCTDGFDMEAVCSECGAKSHASFDSHVLFDMASFKVCGGEAVVKECPCGENVELDEVGACLGEVELDEWTETDEDGITYTFEHRFCTRCDFEIIRKKHSTSEGCYTYLHRQTSIVDGDKVLYSFNEPRYDAIDFHELVYSYSGGKIDSCENGYTAEASCKKCGYTAEVTESTHALKFDFEKIDLSALGACGGYLLIKKCPCEKSSDVGYSLFCDYEYSYAENNLNGEMHTVKTYTCKDCKMEFIYDEYIKDGKVYGLWRLSINGNLKYELSLAF